MRAKNAVLSDCLDEAGSFDIGILAERLLLFERVVMRSTKLTEISSLAEAFGAERLTRLLNEGALAIDSLAYSIANNELSPLRYRIISIQDAAPDASKRRHLDRLLGQLTQLRVGQHRRLALLNAVERAIVRPPEGFMVRALRGLRRDLEADIPSVRTGALLAASTRAGVSIRPNDLELRFRADGPDEFRAETNLMRLGFSEEDTHAIARGTLLAIATTEKKLEQMRVYRAITEFRENEVVILDEIANYDWTDAVVADVQADRLRRVLRLKGFPDFSRAAARGQIDFKALLAARAADGWGEFRSWLASLDQHSDAELQRQMDSILPAILAVSSSPGFKLIKFALGKLPSPVSLEGAEIAVDAAAAAAERMLEAPLARAVPLAFLDDKVGSILRDGS